MNTITEFMVENKLADNGFSAGHIATGLKLYQFDRPTQEAMCRLYRKWRPKTDKKNDLLPSECYDLVLAGVDPDDVEPRQMEFVLGNSTVNASSTYGGDVSTSVKTMSLHDLKGLVKAGLIIWMDEK